MPTKTRIQVYVDLETAQRLTAMWEKDKEKTGYDLSFSEWFERWLKMQLEREK